MNALSSVEMKGMTRWASNGDDNAGVADPAKPIIKNRWQVPTASVEAEVYMQWMCTKSNAVWSTTTLLEQQLQLNHEAARLVEKTQHPHQHLDHPRKDMEHQEDVGTTLVTTGSSPSSTETRAKA